MMASRLKITFAGLPVTPTKDLPVLKQAGDLPYPAPAQAGETQTCPPCLLCSRDPAQCHPNDVPSRTMAGRVEPGLDSYWAGSSLGGNTRETGIEGGDTRETGTEGGERTGGDFQGRIFL